MDLDEGHGMSQAGHGLCSKEEEKKKLVWI